MKNQEIYEEFRQFVNIVLDSKNYKEALKKSKAIKTVPAEVSEKFFEFYSINGMLGPEEAFENFYSNVRFYQEEFTALRSQDNFVSGKKIEKSINNHLQEVKKTQESYTPGPWKAHPHFESVIGGNGEFVCLLVKQGSSVKPETKANVNLIASAPELLEALKIALNHIRGLYEYQEANGLYGDSQEYKAEEIIVATINKAEGRVE